MNGGTRTTATKSRQTAEKKDMRAVSAMSCSVPSPPSIVVDRTESVEAC